MPKVKNNPQVFFDISIDGRAAERITFELFSNVVPKTAENFRALCTGEKGLGASTKKPLYFKGTNIHRIIKGFMAQGGDFSRGDGRGGESIYGENFADENFKLKHDQPGILSMANSGPDSNGSQFFITFKAVPHLDGKHVVFGKAVSGIALLKKLEAVGSEGGLGKPACQVKIVDCGEVSDIVTQNQQQGEKKKKLKRAAEDNSDAEVRIKTKRPPSDDKRRKKRKHYSSDSSSSDTSDSRSHSSDSVSESDSYSSASLDSSSSSDHRHKRRKGSKKDKRKSAKRKSSHKRSKRKSRGTKRKSKRSYGNSSDDSEGSKTSSSSSETESAGRHAKHSLKKADQENVKVINFEKSRTMEDAGKGEQDVIIGKVSHEGSKPPKKDENGADDSSGNQNSENRSAKIRNDPVASSRSNPIRVDGNKTKADGSSAVDSGISRADADRKPLSNEPVPTNGKDLAKGSIDNGQPQRIRKGRGFTQEYAFARRYRTPSPERSPVRSRYNGGRNDGWNSYNRYGRNGPYGARSPGRRYGVTPRDSSPSRYPRRDRSRSRSRSPGRRRDHGGYRRPSPRRNRSPAEHQRRNVINRPRSGRGGNGGPDHRGSSPPANRGRSRSRSKSRDPSRSRSPDAAPVKRGSSKYDRRRSSSSRSSSPAGSRGGLVSY